MRASSSGQPNVCLCALSRVFFWTTMWLCALSDPPHPCPQPKLWQSRVRPMLALSRISARRFCRARVRSMLHGNRDVRWHCPRRGRSGSRFYNLSSRKRSPVSETSLQRMFTPNLPIAHRAPDPLLKGCETHQRRSCFAGCQRRKLLQVSCARHLD